MIAFIEAIGTLALVFGAIFFLICSPMEGDYPPMGGWNRRQLRRLEQGKSSGRFSWWPDKWWPYVPEITRPLYKCKIGPWWLEEFPDRKNEELPDGRVAQHWPVALIYPPRKNN